MASSLLPCVVIRGCCPSVSAPLAVPPDSCLWVAEVQHSSVPGDSEQDCGEMGLKPTPVHAHADFLTPGLAPEGPLLAPLRDITCSHQDTQVSTVGQTVDPWGHFRAAKQC